MNADERKKGRYGSATTKPNWRESAATAATTRRNSEPMTTPGVQGKEPELSQPNNGWRWSSSTKILAYVAATEEVCRWIMSCRALRVVAMML